MSYSLPIMQPAENGMLHMQSSAKLAQLCNCVSCVFLTQTPFALCVGCSPCMLEANVKYVCHQNAALSVLPCLVWFSGYCYCRFAKLTFCRRLHTYALELLAKN